MKKQKELSETELKKLLKEADTAIKKIGLKDFRKKSKLETGDLIYYKYLDPVTKMKKFDASPLAIVVKTFKRNGKGYMFAVNLHWMKPKDRLKTWNYILNNYYNMASDITSDKMRTRKLVRLTYNQIKSDATLNKAVLGRNAFRLYLQHIMKGVRYVPQKYYKKIFGKDVQNILRSRWAKQEKDFVIPHFRDKKGL